jgi:hypothetical protein
MGEGGAGGAAGAAPGSPGPSGGGGGGGGGILRTISGLAGKLLSPASTSAAAEGAAGHKVVSPKSHPPPPGYEWMSRFDEDDEEEDVRGGGAGGAGGGNGYEEEEEERDDVPSTVMTKSVNFLAAVASPNTWLRRRDSTAPPPNTERTEHTGRRTPDVDSPSTYDTQHTRSTHHTRATASEYDDDEEHDVGGSTPRGGGGGGGGALGFLDIPVPLSRAVAAVAISFLATLLVNIFFGVAVVSLGSAGVGGSTAVGIPFDAFHKRLKAPGLNPRT